MGWLAYAVLDLKKNLYTHTLAQLGFWHPELQPQRQTMKFKKSQLFTELPCIWLSNLKFVECSKTRFYLKY